MNKELIKKINEFIPNNEVKDYSFDDLTKKINNKTFIDLFKTFLIEVYTLNNSRFNVKNTKKIISSYVIYYHKDIVTNKHNCYTKLLYVLSKKIIENHSELFNYKSNKTENLIKLYNNYLFIFNKWKNVDKKIILNDLIKIYFEVDELKNSTKENKEYEKILKEHSTIDQSKIIEKIRIIGGEEGMEYFDNIKKIIETNNENIKKLEKQISENMNKAFWDFVVEQIKSENYKIVIDLLKDIQLLLFKCVPNRRDLHFKIMKSLDIEYLEDMLDNQSIDDKLIIDTIFKIIHWINEFNSKEDLEFKEWTKNLEKELDNFGRDHFDREIDVSELLPRTLKYLLEKLDTINKLIDEFKVSDVYKLLKMSKNKNNKNNK